MSGSSLLKVCGLRVAFTSHGRRFVAVQDVSFTVGNGESIGIVGESGSGKSTVARSILGLLQGGVRPIEKAEISVEGQPIAVEICLVCEVIPARWFFKILSAI